MAVHRDCGGCAAGDHDKHNGSHSGPPGLLGEGESNWFSRFLNAFWRGYFWYE